MTTQAPSSSMKTRTTVRAGDEVISLLQNLQRRKIERQERERERISSEVLIMTPRDGAKADQFVGV